MSPATRVGPANYGYRLPLWLTTQISTVDPGHIGYLTQEIIASDSNFAGWVGGSTYVTILDCSQSSNSNESIYQVRTPEGVVGWISDRSLYQQ
jgi:hypothetical protein